jgi:uncharacterized repeat protein (TIGR03803 family)
MDGTDPPAGVTFDRAGNIFGTTFYGGANDSVDGGDGTIWEITATGAYEVLHSFGGGADGIGPAAGVTIDTVGNMYGTTTGGGLNGSGMVWEITKAGEYKDLHDFGSGSDGSEPTAGVTVDSSGDLFGTTSKGGAHGTDGSGGTGGMVWEITAAGKYKDLHDFGSGIDGEYPEAGVTLDPSGNLYGTATEGGIYSNGDYGCGIAWEITKGGVYKVLHEFGKGKDGQNPYSGVTLDAAGNLYGTAFAGGRYPATGAGGGIVWEITTAGDYRDIHDFGNGSDGYFPLTGEVILDRLGNVYGAVGSGGLKEAGMVWEITKAGAYKDLHDFGSAKDGQGPNGNVSLDSADNVYGTTHAGGAYGDGTVWVIAQGSLTGLTLSPAVVAGGGSATGKATIGAAAPVGGFSISLSNSSAMASAPGSVTVAAGTTSATFTVTTLAVAADKTVTISAADGRVTKSANLTVEAPTLKSLTLDPTTVAGGSTSTGTVTLSSIAPAGGLAFSLLTNSSSASVPSTVTVLAGKTSARFTVKTTAPKKTTTVNVQAKRGPTEVKTVQLTIDP